jgi:hypothetical protein
MAAAAVNGKRYDDDYEYDSIRQQRSYDQPAKIMVINGDCLDTVMHIKKKYPDCNPVVLNMANAHSPGGGWRDGLSYLVFLFKNYLKFVKVVEHKKKIFIVVQIYFNVLKILTINLKVNETGLIQYLM